MNVAKGIGVFLGLCDGLFQATLKAVDQGAALLIYSTTSILSWGLHRFDNIDLFGGSDNSGDASESPSNSAAEASSQQTATAPEASSVAQPNNDITTPAQPQSDTAASDNTRTAALPPLPLHATSESDAVKFPADLTAGPDSGAQGPFSGALHSTSATAAAPLTGLDNQDGLEHSENEKVAVTGGDNGHSSPSAFAEYGKLRGRLSEGSDRASVQEVSSKLPNVTQGNVAENAATTWPHEVQQDLPQLQPLALRKRTESQMERSLEAERAIMDVGLSDIGPQQGPQRPQAPYNGVPQGGRSDSGLLGNGTLVATEGIAEGGNDVVGKGGNVNTMGNMNAMEKEENVKTMGNMGKEQVVGSEGDEGMVVAALKDAAKVLELPVEGVLGKQGSQALEEQLGMLRKAMQLHFA